MTNENPSRDTPSRQQSAERAQSGPHQQGGVMQHGMGPGAEQSGARHLQGQAGATSAWQAGRSAPQAGSALQSRRGPSQVSPYSGGPWGRSGGPFSMMRRISEEMDRLFENFGLGREGFPAEGGLGESGALGEEMPSMWSPHIEVCERSGKLLIQADLPGMKREDINVRVEPDQVVIQGERQQDQSTNRRGFYRSERSYGSFYRTIPLPEGTNTESATAAFRDGVLEIELDAPRKEERGRTLEIREGGGGAGSQRTGAGTGSGSTYGGGASGSMTGSTASTATAQQGASGSAGGSQQSAGGTTGTQHSASGTMYSGSGDPAAGAAGIAGSEGERSTSKSSRGSRGS